MSYLSVSNYNYERSIYLQITIMFHRWHFIMTNQCYCDSCWTDGFRVCVCARVCVCVYLWMQTCTSSCACVRGYVRVACRCISDEQSRFSRAWVLARLVEGVYMCFFIPTHTHIYIQTYLNEWTFSNRCHDWAEAVYAVFLHRPRLNNSNNI